MKAASFGGPIVLAIIGAILAFALNFQVGGIDIKFIGYLLIGAGIVWLLLELLRGASGSKVSNTTVSRDSAGRETVRESETSSNI